MMPGERFYPQIDVAGTPREMGLSHGRQLRDRIRSTVDVIRSRVGVEPYDASWRDFQETLAYCRERAPDLIEEMEGIAEGAGIEFRHVFNLNADLDILAWKRLVWDAGKTSEAAACSSHAVATPSEVLLGWNGDSWTGWMDYGAIVRGRPAHGEPFIYWSFAGSVGRPGMNGHLALGANSLPSHRWRPDGLLYPMLSRRVLGCRSAEEGIEMFRASNACCGMNYLIADRGGNLVDIELNADSLALQRPADQGTENYLLHTNCFLDSDLAGREVDLDAACPRLSAARRLYRERAPADVAGVRAVQSDHTGGVCVHREESCTIVSFVAEVRAGRFHVIRGNPCEGSPQTYTVA
jgi:isopenicillin-N N-acyltransferase-like protein